MKRTPAICAGIVSFAVLASTVLPVSSVVVWNTTASAPRGLYLIEPAKVLRAGERTALRPPAALEQYLAERGYLPSGVPLVKEVAGLGGDTVCRLGLEITVNGRYVGKARKADSRGRNLPAWQGCRTLKAGDIFVMNPRAQDSFDGRYFGALGRENLLGRAVPVWTDEEGAGAHVWFASTALTHLENPNQGDDQ